MSDMEALNRAQETLTRLNNDHGLNHFCAEWTESDDDGCEICWRFAIDIDRALRGATVCKRCRGTGMPGPEGDACDECSGSGEFDPGDGDWQFAPEVDRLWDALTKRGMHYDRESMEADEPNLAQRHRASLSLALDEGGWVPRSEAEALAEALRKIDALLEADMNRGAFMVRLDQITADALDLYARGETP